MLHQCNRQCRRIVQQVHGSNMPFVLEGLVRTASTSSTSSSIPELLEMREYTLKPKGIKSFMKITNDKVALRNELLPFLGMFACDTGGTLNRVVHFYNYTSLEARDEARQRAAAHTEWQQDYLDHSRPHVAHQTSSLWLPAMPVLHAARIVQPGHFSSPAKPPPGAPPVLYELRSYQLTHGWGAVPTWVDAFAQGVPSKIDAAADADPDAVPTLVFAGYSEVGPMNCTMELWRHASSSACTRAREASRLAAPWRASVAEIAKITQHFTVSYLQPVTCSPWQ